MKDNIVTTDRLMAFLCELRCRKHYIFAMLKDAELTDLYLRGWAEKDGACITDDITLARFLTCAHNFGPDDAFKVYLDIRSGYEREYVDPDNVNLITLDETDDFRVDEFERLFEAYMRYLCEKCARNGDLLQISAELIMRCDLTPEDVEILTPMVERFNERAIGMLRREYAALKDLPFIKDSDGDAS